MLCKYSWKLLWAEGWSWQWFCDRLSTWWHDKYGYIYFIYFFVRVWHFCHFLLWQEFKKILLLILSGKTLKGYVMEFYSCKRNVCYFSQNWEYPENNLFGENCSKSFPKLHQQAFFYVTHFNSVSYFISVILYFNIWRLFIHCVPKKHPWHFWL